MALLEIFLFAFYVGIVLASLYYWYRVIAPSVAVIRSAEQIKPLLTELRNQLINAPSQQFMLEEIFKEVHSTEGTPLRELLDRLEVASTTAAELAVILQKDVSLLGYFAKDTNAKTDLAATAAAVVAEDLENSHIRAEGLIDGHPGEASDAAMIRPPHEYIIS